MTTGFDLAIRNGRCVFPWGEAEAEIGVRDGRIAAIGAGPFPAAQTIDARGLHVLPGLIDAHVHLRDPGHDPDAPPAASPAVPPPVENIDTGTRAALLGGLCAVFDMPNTSPPLVDAASLARKAAHVERAAWCDVGLYVGATQHNAGALAELEAQPGVCGVKVFAGSSTGDLLVADDAGIERVLRAGRRRVAFHSEDETRLRARKPLFASGGDYALHAEWRDVECAFLGTRRIAGLARKAGRPIHILHVSTAEELAWLAPHRDLVSIELLVNHLTQAAPECYERLGGLAVMNPPLRDARHRDAAWAAVADGTVDVVGSDHAPHPLAAKRLPWPDCAAGLTGTQTLAPLMLDHVNAGRLSLARLVDLMCAGPARVYGLLGKGRLAVGFDADFTLVDMGARRTIENRWIASPCGWTPFDGMAVRGWPAMTILRGAVAMRDDEVLGRPRGQLARFAG